MRMANIRQLGWTPLSITDVRFVIRRSQAAAANRPVRVSGVRHRRPMLTFSAARHRRWSQGPRSPRRSPALLIVSVALVGAITLAAFLIAGFPHGSGQTVVSGPRADLVLSPPPPPAAVCGNARLLARPVTASGRCGLSAGR